MPRVKRGTNESSAVRRSLDWQGYRLTKSKLHRSARNPSTVRSSFPTVTGVPRNANSAASLSSGSEPPPAAIIFPTVDLSTASGKRTSRWTAESWPRSQSRTPRPSAGSPKAPKRRWRLPENFRILDLKRRAPGCPPRRALLFLGFPEPRFPDMRW